MDEDRPPGVDDDEEPGGWQPPATAPSAQGDAGQGYGTHAQQGGYADTHQGFAGWGYDAAAAQGYGAHTQQGGYADAHQGFAGWGSSQPAGVQPCRPAVVQQAG